MISIFRVRGTFNHITIENVDTKNAEIRGNLRKFERNELFPTAILVATIGNKNLSVRTLKNAHLDKISF